MSNTIYSTKKAYVFIGDTNNGKTSTINTILSCLTDQNVQLYTKNGINASKCITIIHFETGTTNQKYRIKYNDIVTSFNNIEGLQNKYNSAIEKLSDCLVKYVHIYIPIHNKLLYDYLFIDVIGKTADNVSAYNEQLNRINYDYPNNIKIFVTKSLSVDMCTSNDNILLTHADEINYTENLTDLEIHKSIIENNPTKINYISNVNNSMQIITDVNNIVYNKNNVVHYLNKLIKQFKNNITIPINQFLDHMLRYKYVNNMELFNEIRKFNNNKLLEEAKIIFKLMISLDEVKKKIKKFNSDIVLMREHYRCYEKNGSGQRAQQYIMNSKISLFSELYKNVSNNIVCNRYINDQKELYKNKIIALNDQFNNEPKLINVITTELPMNVKKRSFAEL